jgi:hypothetical protein
MRPGANGRIEACIDYRVGFVPATASTGYRSASLRRVPLVRAPLPSPPRWLSAALLLPRSPDRVLVRAALLG